jgi:hypothetical protein
MTGTFVPPPESPDATREAFEAWARERRWCLDRHEISIARLGLSGEMYTHSYVNSAWIAWQAATEAAHVALAKRDATIAAMGQEAVAKDAEIARLREALQRPYPVLTHGCICQVGAEDKCKSWLCPRRAPSFAQHSLVSWE